MHAWRTITLEVVSDSCAFSVDYIIDVKHGGRPIRKKDVPNVMSAIRGANLPVCPRANAGTSSGEQQSSRIPASGQEGSTTTT